VRLRALLIAVAACSCARALPPPGGTRDTEPPRIVETEPAQGAVVPNFTGPARFIFDETLSERGPRQGEMVDVSPAAEEVDVDRDGKELKVSIPGGFRPGRIYHLTVRSGFADRGGNARTTPYELVFSTGPQIPTTALGGLVRDRLTGKPVANARVIAVSGNDTTATYVTQTDTGGFYALRALPVGPYVMTAFTDLDRNGKIDFREARQVKTAGVATPRDTAVVEFVILAPDTTPARLVRAEAKDSQQVRLVFDDFINPSESIRAVRVSVALLPDSTLLEGELMFPREYEKRQRAARDTTAAAAARADTIAPLPTQELVWLSRKPLPPKRTFRLIVFGLRNLADLPEGGGSVTFETPAAPTAAPRK
jgi:hypothetical protein